MKRSDQVLLQDVAGESILIPVGAKVGALNGLIVLNATGRFVWEQLAAERSLDELASDVAARFEVDETTARKDVEAFLESLSSLGLLGS